MIISINHQGRSFQIDAAEPLSVAIPLEFNGAQPNAYGVERAASTACEAGEIIGDTRRGGSCNFEQIKMIPHCSGTHTECAGHITHERISVDECLNDAFSIACLISITPQKASDSGETYPFDLQENDSLITRKAIEKALTESNLTLIDALIIRTLPNDSSKLSRIYSEDIPPFFSTEALKFIAASDIKHLLVDTPSIDRIYDGGKLSNHRIFWDIEQNAFEVSEKSLINRTITELIYVPNEISDGEYLLNLQIPPFAADAAPSRPVLFRLREVGK